MTTRSGIDERDLWFAPVHNEQPRTLTPAQLEQFNSDGIIGPFRIFGPDEVRRNRTYLDFLLDEFRAAGRDSYAINGYHTRCRRLFDLATHPLLLDHVEDLLGSDFVCWGSHFFVKLAQDPKAVPWHQDASFWPFTPARTVTVWLAIDDADEQNSAVRFLTGSHRAGPLEWGDPTGPAVLTQELVGTERLLTTYDVVVNALAAGEISLHADMIAHASEPNRSDRRRAGLTLRYCPTSVRLVGDADWNQQAILCRGRDEEGYWSNVPRPRGEDLSLETAEPSAIGGK